MTDLCALEDVKAWLATGNLPFPATDDQLLARTITAASVFIERWVGRPVGIAAWQEIRNGRWGGAGLRRMQLWATPIKSILLLAINGTAIPALPSTVQFPTTGPGIVPSFTGPGFARGYTFTPTELRVSGAAFCYGDQNIVVQYTAGYDPIPADIEQACIELTVRKYRERTRIAEHSRSLGGAETVSYSTVAFSMHDMVTDIQVLLQQYRQVSPLLPATLLGVPPAPPFVLEDTTTVIELEDQVTPITAEAPP